MLVHIVFHSHVVTEQAVHAVRWRSRTVLDVYLNIDHLISIERWTLMTFQWLVTKSGRTWQQSLLARHNEYADSGQGSFYA